MLRPVDLSFLPIDPFSGSGGLAVVVSGVKIDPVLWLLVWGDARGASSVLVFTSNVLEANEFERGSRRAMKQHDYRSVGRKLKSRDIGDAFTFTSSDRGIWDSHYECGDGLVPLATTVVFFECFTTGT